MTMNQETISITISFKESAQIMLGIATLAYDNIITPEDATTIANKITFALPQEIQEKVLKNTRKYWEDQLTGSAHPLRETSRQDPEPATEVTGMPRAGGPQDPGHRGRHGVWSPAGPGDGE